MSDKVKISDLPEATSVADEDVLPIVQGGVTKKVRAEHLPGQDLGFTPENVNNKRTTWSGLVTHVNYPSEKLTKETIEAFTTATAIKDKVQSLEGLNRISKTAIRSGEQSLNLRSFLDILLLQHADPAVMFVGDFWVHSGADGAVIAGEWVVCLNNNPTVPTSLQGFIDSADWWVVSYKMKPVDIRDALHTLQGEHMLSADNIVYTGNTSLKLYITTALMLNINSRQKRLYTERYQVMGVGENSTFTIIGKAIHPIMLHVNRIAYSGKQGEPESVGAFDYTYKHVGENTVLTSNTSFDPPLMFASGDIIDLLHSVESIGSIDDDEPITYPGGED